MTVKRVVISWQMFVFGLPLIIMIVGWVIHVETRLSVSDRVENLENLLNPLLVEWKVQQRLKELAPEDYVPPHPVPPHEHPEYTRDEPIVAPDPTPDPSPPDTSVLDRIRKESEDWADDATQSSLRH